MTEVPLEHVCGECRQVLEANHVQPCGYVQVTPEGLCFGLHPVCTCMEGIAFSVVDPWCAEHGDGGKAED